jgi:hypothetical protein
MSAEPKWRGTFSVLMFNPFVECYIGTYAAWLKSSSMQGQVSIPHAV